MDYKISVLIPVYGTEKYIEQCFTSLVQNTIASDCEFIFINDCTKDNAIVILESLIPNYPELQNNIKIINHQTNLGSAAARNTGLENATGKYIICTDSDDWVEKDYLEKLYLEAENSNADIVTCCFFEETEKGQTLQKQFLTDNQNDNYKNFLLDNIKGYLWCKLIKRSLFTDFNIKWKNGFNMQEDTYIMSQLFLVANNYSSISNYLYHYRIANSTNMTNQKNLKRFIESFGVFNYIKQLLQNKNLLDKYKNEYMFRILWLKMSFSLTYHFSKKELTSLFSENERKFMKNNLSYFNSSKKIYIKLFNLKFLYLLSAISFLLGKIQKKYIMEFSKISENADFLHSCDF